MYSIVSTYYEDSYKDFCDNFDDYIAFVGLSDGCDCDTTEEFYKDTLEGQ